jgi:hypothetical protein
MGLCDPIPIAQAGHLQPARRLCLLLLETTSHISLCGMTLVETARENVTLGTNAEAINGAVTPKTKSKVLPEYCIIYFLCFNGTVFPRFFCRVMLDG